LNVAYKVFSIILTRKPIMYSEKTVIECQCGFHPSRSTVEQIFILRRPLVKCYEFGIHVHMLFTDYKQAFDGTYQYQIQRSFESYGILSKLINLAKMALSQSCNKVMVRNHDCQSFCAEANVRQSEALLATVFNLALYRTIQDIQIQGTTVNWRTQLFGMQMTLLC
jgi:Reverse transcriptase (RNA-dependent DNA polymerase).